MIYDRDPLAAPTGMTFRQMLALPVDEGEWRESHRYVCAHCIQSAFHHPYTNVIWGCRQCGTTTTDIVDHFVTPFQVPGDSLENEASEAERIAADEIRNGRSFLTERDEADEKPEQLSEFRVALQRVPKGEFAVDANDRRNQGTRTKLGGEPDWIQLNDGTPTCTGCESKMTFVAQIDSIDHVSPRNPIWMDRKNRDSSKKPWMFGDVGMIYVFYCFNCGETKSVFQEY
ncbi:MAG: hypothetical protein JWP03_3353 [Phycisphaerales bacterium]|jgi:ribosomal protein L37AE/L43A|nr:hypothetical protein [Phycisphaerales bacterium]